MDLACYILVKANPVRDFEGTVFCEQVLSLLQALLQHMGKPTDLNHLVSALHHFEALALAYCNQHDLDERAVLQASQNTSQWSPALRNVLQSHNETHQNHVLQALVALTSNRIFFEKKTASLPLLMLVSSNHRHLVRVLEAIKAVQPVADPGDDTAVTEVDLQQALEARKVWQLSMAQGYRDHLNSEYDDLLLSEQVTGLMNEELWAAEWLQPAGNTSNNNVISWRRLQNCLFQDVFSPSIKHS